MVFLPAFARPRYAIGNLGSHGRVVHSLVEEVLGVGLDKFAAEKATYPLAYWIAIKTILALMKLSFAINGVTTEERYMPMVNLVFVQTHIMDTVVRTVECSETSNCYCVQPGQCQIPFHIVQLDELYGIGNLQIALEDDICSGQCELQITVVNQAGSSTVQIHRLKIDTTAPETGNAKIDIVKETSSLNSSATRLEWSGFEDQESAIRFYRAYVSDHCLTTNDTMLDSNTTSYEEVKASKSMHELSRDYAGTRYVTVVAFNGALTASHPVCSEGIEGLVPLPGNAGQISTAVTVGASVGVIIAIAIISIAIVLLVRKYRSKTNEPSDDPSSHPPLDISNEGVSNATYGEAFGDWNGDNSNKNSPNPGIYELARNPVSEALYQPNASFQHFPASNFYENSGGNESFAETSINNLPNQGIYSLARNQIGY